MILMQHNSRTFDSPQNLDLVNQFQNHQEVSIQGHLSCKDRRLIQRHRLSQKSRKNWTRRQRQIYAQTLQAFQDSQINRAESFYQHLAEVLGRSPQQVRVYHHKMISQYVYTRRVVTSILGKRASRNSRNICKKTTLIDENAQYNYYEKENILAQNFSSNQQAVFPESSIALTSLDQYQDSSQEIQVFQLQQDDCFDQNEQNIKNYQDWSTNASEGRASSQDVQMVELMQE